MTIAGANYVVYAFFPFPYWVSALIAVVIALPSGTLFAVGMWEAGEVWCWWVIAFLCDSPALVIHSIIRLPIFHRMCRAEERGLVIRYGTDYSSYRATTGMYLPRALNPGVVPRYLQCRHLGCGDAR